MSGNSAGGRTVIPAESMYSFRWPVDGSNHRTWSRRLKAAVDAAVARSVAGLSDDFLDSPMVTRMILTFLPYVMRLKFHRSAAKTVAGGDLTATVAVGLILANGDRRFFLVRVRNRRCRISPADWDQVQRDADSCFISRLPAIIRMEVGATTHPALLVAMGAAEIRGDVFLSARLAPLFGMPTRSLLEVDE